MTTIYIKDADGKKVAVQVTDEVAAADAETRRAEWRNEAKQRYYCGRTLDTLTDDAIEYRQEKPESRLMTASPEDEHIAADERADLKAALTAALKSLTPEQIELVKMLKSGISVNAIAAKLGVDKSAISHRRKRIQEKIKKFLK